MAIMEIKKVLLIEKDPRMVFSISYFLGKLGYVVKPSNDPEDINLDSSLLMINDSDFSEEVEQLERKYFIAYCVDLTRTAIFKEKNVQVLGYNFGFPEIKKAVEAVEALKKAGA